MADHPNAEMFRSAMEALAAADLDGFAGALTDDVVWHAPGTSRFGGRFEGKEAVLDRMRRMREAGIRTRFEVHDVLGNDVHVVALVHMHVENAEGGRYHEPQVNVMHVRGGKVAEFWAMNQDQPVIDTLLG